MGKMIFNARKAFVSNSVLHFTFFLGDFIEIMTANGVTQDGCAVFSVCVTSIQNSVVRL